MSDKSMTIIPEETAVTADEATSPRTFVPHVDIIEKADQLAIYADMPGVAEKNIEITLEKDCLTIKGRADKVQAEGLKRIYSEIPDRFFERTFILSDRINRDDIEASIKNGLLTITLSKTDSAKKKKIAVQSQVS